MSVRKEERFRAGSVGGWFRRGAFCLLLLAAALPGRAERSWDLDAAAIPESAATDSAVIVIALKNNSGATLAAGHKNWVSGIVLGNEGHDATAHPAIFVRSASNPRVATFKFNNGGAAAGTVQFLPVGGTDGVDSIVFDVAATNNLQGGRLYFCFDSVDSPAMTYSKYGAAVVTPSSQAMLDSGMATAEFSCCNTKNNPTVQDLYLNTSNVDIYSYPLTVTCVDTAGAILALTGENFVANPLLNRADIFAAYVSFMNGPRGQPAYLALAEPSATNPDSGILSPGSLLTNTYKVDGIGGQLSTSPLNYAFDDAIDSLFREDISLSMVGDGTASIPADTYTVEHALVPRPQDGASGHKFPALKFTGVNRSANVFYLWNPKELFLFGYVDPATKANTFFSGTFATGSDTSRTTFTFSPAVPADCGVDTGMYAMGCGMSVAIQPTVQAINYDKTGKIASVVLHTISDMGTLNKNIQIQFSYTREIWGATVGNAAPVALMTAGAAVFGNCGAFSDPYTLSGDAASVCAGLQRDVCCALIRGVANLPRKPADTASGWTTRLWETEANWYPDASDTPVLESSRYALFLHTATLPGVDGVDTNIFCLPRNPAKCAWTGAYMAQVYAFGYDETPGHIPGQPEVPPTIHPAPSGTDHVEIRVDPWTRPPTRTVVFTAGAHGLVGKDASTDTSSITQTTIVGGSCSPVTAVPDDKYGFASWSDGGKANPLTLTNVTTDMALTANFAAGLPVAFKAVGGGSFTSRGKSGANLTLYAAKGGACLPLTAVPAAGYVFSGWSGDVASADNPLTVTNVTKALNVTANFAVGIPVTFTAGANGSLQGGGKSGSSIVLYAVSGGACAPVTAVANSGHAFARWSGDASGSTNPLTVTNVTQALNVTATFGALCTVTFNGPAKGGVLKAANGASGATLTQQVAAGGDCQTVTAVPDYANGYMFFGWGGDTTTYDNPVTVRNVTANMAVNAGFGTGSTGALTMLASPANGGTTTPTLSPPPHYGIPVNVAQSIQAIPADGYSFTGWTVGGAGVVADATAASTTVTLSGAVCACTANFQPNVKITVTAGTGGAVIPGTLSYPYGGVPPPYVIVPAAGKMVKDVLVDGVSQGAVLTYNFGALTAGHTLAATFQAIPAGGNLISSAAGAGGTISPCGQTLVPQNGAQAYQVKAGGGSTIGNLWVDGISRLSTNTATDTTYTFNKVLAAHTIAASFIPAAGNALRSIGGNVVTISIRPPTTASSWTCVETVPAGLTPGAITGGGVWDATARRLTWTGTLVKAMSQLSYAVDGDVGSYGLAGTCRLGAGAATPTAGSALVKLTPYHPADVDADFVIDAAELASFKTCWRAGLYPASYYACASKIQSGGGAYSFAAGQKRPLCWASKTAAALDAAGDGETPGRVIADGVNTTIKFTAPDGAFCWVYTEYLPEGLTPIDITGPNACWTPLNRQITWYDEDLSGAAAVELTYSVTGAAEDYSTDGCMASGVSYDGLTEFYTEGDNVWSIAHALFVVTSSAGAGGTITPLGEYVGYFEDSPRYTITAAAGHQIYDVLVDNESVGAVASYTFPYLIANHSVAAYFEPIPGSHVVTFAAGTGGSVGGAAEQRVVDGGDCSPVAAVADAGYYFNDWTGSDSFRDTDKVLTVTNVTKDMEIAAKFETEQVFHVAPGSVFDVSVAAPLFKVPRVSSVFGAKVKVLTKPKYFKGEGLTSFRCQWLDKEAGPYKYELLVNGEHLTDFFYVEQPVLTSMAPDSGSGAAKTPVVILGKFFGSQKPKVTMSYGDAGKEANCALSRPYYPGVAGGAHKSVMDLETGVSRLDFKAPGKIKAGAPSTVTIKFKAAAPLAAPFNQ